MLTPETSVALCGAPDAVIERVGYWRDALGGMDQLLLKFDGGGINMKELRQSLERFAAHVAPHLRVM